jgi:hypothetical protein
VSLENNDVLVLSVSVACNIHCSSVLYVHDSSVVELEKLEPSGVCLPYLQVG